MVLLNSIEHFLEKRCAYCSKPYKSKDEQIYALCPACSENIRRIKSGYCRRCGAVQNLFFKSEILDNCASCDTGRGGIEIGWTKLLFYGVYEEILKDMILQVKFYENLLFTKSLAQIIAPLLEEFPPFDILIPIPVHANKIVDRGYNQCIEIAKFIKQYSKLDFSLELNVLEKDFETKPQSLLSSQERRSNVKGSFLAHREKVENKRILLFDDVSTTGSTLRAATQALLGAGAKEVFVLYIAGTDLVK